MAPDYHARELNEYQEESLSSRPQQHHHPQATPSCFSPILTPNLVLHSSVEEQGGCFHKASQPSDRGLEALPATIGITTSQKLEDQGVKEDHQKGRPEYGSSSSSPSFKWTSSKMRMMRMMRKMITTEKTPTPNKSSAHNSEDLSYPDSITSSCPQMVTHGGCGENPTVRVCLACNTSKTPLWRSGPSGPKTLCNACGIRQRKARRAMAAATANGAIVPPPNVTLPTKCKLKNKDDKRPGSKADIDQESESMKKRFKLPSPTLVPRSETKKLSLEDFAARLSERYSVNLQRVFPQEEKEAAILLMALSCGLVHG